MNVQTKIDAPANVYAKIAAVQGALSKVGISKDGQNKEQKYSFRGIDQVYSALSPLLAANGLVIIPRITKREVVERQTRNGGAIFNVTVWAEFDFISADDGSKHTAATYGEAMDNADKATNKAMSAAYKYAAFMTFAIPTEGDNDADATTHEVAAHPERRGNQNRQPDKDPSPSAMPEAEWAKLISLIEASSCKIGGLMKKYQVENLRHLNHDQYIDAIEGLNGLLAKKAKEESDAKARAANQSSDIDDSDVPF